MVCAAINPEAYCLVSAFEPFSSKFCSTIERSMDVEGLVANAPTRVGKSHTGVSYLLKEHGDVNTLFVSRSINETSNMIRIAKSFVDGVPVMEVVGREHFCINSSLKAMYNDIRAVNDVFPFHFMCQICEFSRGRIPSEDIFAESAVLSYRDIVDLAMSMGVCPARLAYKYAKDRVHIVTNYAFLVDPAVRESSFLASDGGYDPTNVFMDEADVLPSSLIGANCISFPNTGVLQIIDRERTELLRKYEDWGDLGVFTLAGTIADAVCEIRPGPAGEIDFRRVVDFGYEPADLDVINACLRNSLTYVKRVYDIPSKIETFNKIQVSASRGFFTQKLLMGVDYLSTDLDGYSRLPEVIDVIGADGHSTGVGNVKCSKYRFFDGGYYMNFRDSVSFLESSRRWKMFTSATVDVSNFLDWIQVRGDYMKSEFPHVIPRNTMPFYSMGKCKDAKFSIKGLVAEPDRIYSMVNRAVKAFVDRQLSCYVAFPSIEILRRYSRLSRAFSGGVVSYFSCDDPPLADVQAAPLNAKWCSLYFDYCRSKTVRGLDFFNYDVAILVSLPVQNISDWEWEAQQLTRICGRFRQSGIKVSTQEEVKRRAINEAAQFFSRIYTPEKFLGKHFISLDHRLVDCMPLAPVWVRDLFSNVIFFTFDGIPRAFAPKKKVAVDVVEFLKPESPRTVDQLADALRISPELVAKLLDEAIASGRAVRVGEDYFRS